MTVQPPVEDPEAQLTGHMSFLDHLEELRTRILRSLIAVALAFLVCWVFHEQLFQIAAGPVQVALGDQPMVFTTLTGPFSLYLRVALVGAILLSSPFLIAQVWLFITPGLYRHERRFALPFILSGVILGACGVAFGYFIAFPFATVFLIEWGRAAGLEAMITAMEYFNMFLTIMLSLAVIFQIPPVIFVLSRMGIVSAGFLLKNTKYAVLIAFVLAAVITPTADIPNMMIMAGPMILLYIVGVGVAFVFGKREPKA
jgi:sec-independent protein translocase protein TatC